MVPPTGESGGADEPERDLVWVVPTTCPVAAQAWVSHVQRSYDNWFTDLAAWRKAVRDAEDKLERDGATGTGVPRRGLRDPGATGEQLRQRTAALASLATVAKMLRESVAAASAALDTVVARHAGMQAAVKQFLGLYPECVTTGVTAAGAVPAIDQAAQRKRLAAMSAMLDEIDADTRAAIELTARGALAFEDHRVVYPTGRGGSFLNIELRRAPAAQPTTFTPFASTRVEIGDTRSLIASAGFLFGGSGRRRHRYVPVQTARESSLTTTQVVTTTGPTGDTTSTATTQVAQPRTETVVGIESSARAILLPAALIPRAVVAAAPLPPAWGWPLMGRRCPVRAQLRRRAVVPSRPSPDAHDRRRRRGGPQPAGRPGGWQSAGVDRDIHRHARGLSAWRRRGRDLPAVVTGHW